MANLYRFLARSDHWSARAVRRFYWGVHNFSVPAPRVLVRPALWLFLAMRRLLHTAKRVLITEPLFKAYCRRYGRRLRMGIYIPWVQGQGDIILGDHVVFDGHVCILFGSRFADHPTLEVGDLSGIGHNCTFTVGKRITIGRHCRIAENVRMFDSSGHPADPAARLEGRPPTAEDVRPITIHDNVWIGANALIFPGVTLGEGCIVSAGSVVMGDVPPLTVVAGNPARKVLALPQTPRKDLQPVSA